MAWIEKRQLSAPETGKRRPVRYQVRYRDRGGRVHAETFRRMIRRGAAAR